MKSTQIYYIILAVFCFAIAIYQLVKLFNLDTYELDASKNYYLIAKALIVVLMLIVVALILWRKRKHL